MTNYISHARTVLERALPGEDPALMDLYLLLVLVVGPSADRGHVHDAWAIWRSRTRPDHQSIVPFDDLTEAVAQLDDPYVRGIQEAAIELGTTTRRQEAVRRLGACLHRFEEVEGDPAPGEELRCGRCGHRAPYLDDEA